MTSTAASYDETPYHSYPFEESHPSRLSGVARLFGLNPPPLENARILELGCASGGNLVPLAFYFPNMQLVGIDYSIVQVEEGVARIKNLGLKNVELKQISIADITPEFGMFDYIIAHGVYSWVPPEVQDAILRVCNENLSDNGVAYISYNIYPGWKTHEIVRDAMLFHTRNIENHTNKIAHSRGMIQYMNEMSVEDSMFRHIMNNESSLIEKSEAYYIAHEFLETHNNPCYFNEFSQRAEAHGLTYLGDTNIGSMFVESLGEEHKQRLLNVSDNQQVALEQYLDFITNRSFRQTLLVKANKKSSIIRNLAVNGRDILKSLSYQCRAQRVDKPDLPLGAHLYVTQRKDEAMVYSITQQILLKVLSESYPNPISYNELESQIKAQAQDQFSEHELLRILERLMIVSFVTPWDNTFATQYMTLTDHVPTHPLMNKLAVQNVLMDGQLTSHLHQHVVVDAVTHELLSKLDGQHSTEALIDAILDATKEGKLNFLKKTTQEVITDPEEIRQEVLIHVKNSLKKMKDAGFLIKT